MTEGVERMLTVIVILGGIIALQVFLSRKQNKWLGWILPTVWFVCQALLTLSLVFFSAYYEGVQEVVVDGQTMEYAIEPVREILNGGSDMILPALFLFALFNIPTVILIGVYFACREGLKRKKEIERMGIQDLE